MMNKINELVLAGTLVLGLSIGSVHAQCEESRTDVSRILAGVQTKCITTSDDILGLLQCSLDNRESNKTRIALIEKKVDEKLSSICDNENYYKIRQKLISFYTEALNDGYINMSDRANEVATTTPINRIIYSEEYNNNKGN